jgi:hypothetical protein
MILIAMNVIFLAIMKSFEQNKNILFIFALKEHLHINIHTSQENICYIADMLQYKLSLKYNYILNTSCRKMSLGARSE